MDVKLKRRMEGDDGENLGPLRKGEMCGEDEWGDSGFLTLSDRRELYSCNCFLKLQVVI